MKLAHFVSNEYVTPIVSGLERPTKSFLVGAEDVQTIDALESGTRVVVRRKRLPDIVFTPMGHGVVSEPTREP